MRKKTPITGPGSFDNASFLSKLARVILASVFIIITLGLILCFMSTQNLLDFDIRCSCVDGA
ncbi:ulp1 protease family, C-terminal catalytic domain protein, partial [Chlamydia psittaci 84-8471/1]